MTVNSCPGFLAVYFSSVFAMGKLIFPTLYLQCTQPEEGFTCVLFWAMKVLALLGEQASYHTVVLASLLPHLLKTRSREHPGAPFQLPPSVCSPYGQT